MPYSSRYLYFTGFLLILFIIMFFHTSIRQRLDIPEQNRRSALAGVLKLTDLCLVTEARYTRHPAMSDNFAPFQDFPGALEHFPSGSLITPPHYAKRH